jgi:hypothetical protein
MFSWGCDGEPCSSSFDSSSDVTHAQRGQKLPIIQPALPTPRSILSSLHLQTSVQTAPIGGFIFHVAVLVSTRRRPCMRTLMSDAGKSTRRRKKNGWNYGTEVGASRVLQSIH